MENNASHIWSEPPVKYVADYVECIVCKLKIIKVWNIDCSFAEEDKVCEIK